METIKKIKQEKGYTLEVSQDQSFNHFKELYKKDKDLAVKYFRLSGNTPCRVLTFTKISKEKNIECVVEESIGISKTDKLYISKKTVRILVLNWKKRKVYQYSGNKWIRVGFKELNDYGKEGFKKEDILRCIHPRLEYLSKYTAVIAHLKPSMLIKNKLFSLRKLLVHCFPNVPYSTSKIIADYNSTGHIKDLIRLNHMLSNCSNPNAGKWDNYNEQISPYTNNGIIRLLHFEIKYEIVPYLNHSCPDMSMLRATVSEIKDTINMLRELGRTWNIMWSEKRWIEEHKKATRESNEILIKGNDRELKVHIDFPETFPEEWQSLTGFNIELAKTAGRLLQIGIDQGHCVGTYADRVDSGSCAIYTVTRKDEFYTMELTRCNKKVSLGQLKGRRNAPAPEKVREEVLYIVQSHTAYRRKHLNKLVDSLSTNIPVVNEYELAPPF